MFSRLRFPLITALTDAALTDLEGTSTSHCHGAASVDEAGTCPGGTCCGGGVGGACPWVVHPRTGPSRKLGTPYYVGNAVGLADLNALLNSLCNVS